MLNVSSRTTRHDERGSLVITTTLMVALVVVMVTMLHSTMTALQLARTEQERTGAFHFASAGVDQALFRIDKGVLPTVSGSTYTPVLAADGTLDGFDEVVTAAGGSKVEIFARKTPADQDRVWTVRSIGTDASGRRRQAVTTIESTSLFISGFFTDQNFELTGNQDSPVAYDSGVCPTADVVCELPTPIAGTLGTNAEFRGAAATVKTFTDSWGGFKMYGRATFDAADEACAETDCRQQAAPREVVHAITDQLEIEVPPPPSGSLPCPSGGVFGATTGTTTVASGDYVCDGAVSLIGNIAVGTDPITGAPGRVRIFARSELSAASDAVINRHGETWRFQVLQSERAGGAAWSGGICGAEIWALLYTPSLDIACNGSHQPSIYGAVVARLHAGTGNHFDFHWDISAADHAHNARYVVRNWRECNANDTSC